MRVEGFDARGRRVAAAAVEIPGFTDYAVARTCAPFEPVS